MASHIIASLAKKVLNSLYVLHYYLVVYENKCMYLPFITSFRILSGILHRYTAIHLRLRDVLPRYIVESLELACRKSLEDLFLQPISTTASFISQQECNSDEVMSSSTTDNTFSFLPSNFSSSLVCANNLIWNKPRKY